MKFTKMHGLGNDYVYVIPDRERDWPQLSIAISDRHQGIGGDGLVLAMPSNVADFRMRIFNADGSEAELSGNGIRCATKFAVEEGLVPGNPDEVSVETLAGVKRLQLFREAGEIRSLRVDMGTPSFAPSSLPALVDGPGPIVDYPLEIDGVALKLTLVSVGNPHAVHFLDSDPESFPLERIGPLVEHHPLFPNRVNFQVVQVLSRTEVRHEIWERGSGVTLSSGSSASAVCVAARLHGFTGDRIVDHMPGGDIDLEWDGVGSVFMTGPAVRIFDGTWPD